MNTYGEYGNNEPVHDKNCNKTCWTSKDSNQSVLAKSLVYPSLDNPEAVQGTCDQRRL